MTPMTLGSYHSNQFDPSNTLLIKYLYTLTHINEIKGSKLDAFSS